MSSGRVPPPLLQKRCFSRASSSTEVERRDAEVVEEVLAQLEVAELVRGNEEQERLEGDVALAKHSAQAERRFGVARRRR